MYNNNLFNFFFFLVSFYVLALFSKFIGEKCIADLQLFQSESA